MVLTYEPAHDKIIKMYASSEDEDQPAQSDLSSLCAHWVRKDLSFLQADSEDSDQTTDAQADRSFHWAHVPPCWFCRALTQI